MRLVSILLLLSCVLLASPVSAKASDNNDCVTILCAWQKFFNRFDSPQINGSTEGGSRLTIDDTDNFLQWQRCDFTGNNCVDIAGAFGPEYTTSALDLGMTLRVQTSAKLTDEFGPIIDTTKPEMYIPADMIVKAPGPDGIALYWQTVAQDNMDGIIQVSCIPASGSVFKIQTEPHPVVCISADSSGNDAIKVFSIKVV